MEYTKLQYFLFKIGELFDSKLFIALIAFVIVIGAALFFVYDYKTDGPVLSSGLNNNKSFKENKHGKKYSKKTEIWFAVVPILILILLFIAKSSFSHVPSPETIVPSGKYKTATTGKVLWIHNNTGKIAITTSERKEDNPIVAKVNNIPVMPDTQLISSYGGTTLTNKEFLSLSVGDEVKIKVKPFEWKYKNHSDFANDSNSENAMKLLNQGKVNGKVEKVNKDTSSKKVNKSSKQKANKYSYYNSAAKASNGY